VREGNAGYERRGHRGRDELRGSPHRERSSVLFGLSGRHYCAAGALASRWRRAA
jgi:hypothetical protein